MKNILAVYYENQLKKRKTRNNNSKLYNSRVELFSQVLLRKTYVLSRNLNSFKTRRSWYNISSYSETMCSIRTTKTYIGFPRHILSFVFKR